ncbi:MAG: metalloregulator ArsR/SmtB family transcription factor [Lentisphaeria bacterium]|nr:metalloregulator ArsR/SmtB family transcription factor [Lentisphaeria bacterium]
MLKSDNCSCEVSPQNDVQGNLASDDTLEEMAMMFKSLSDPSRLKIINALLLSEMCVHAISQTVEMSQPAVSHHLKQLRQQRLVKCRRVGKSIYYVLNDYHVQLLFDLCRTHICESSK